MANFEGCTSSSGGEIVNKDGLEEYLKQWDYPCEDMTVAIEPMASEDPEEQRFVLQVYGYDWFDVKKLVTDPESGDLVMDGDNDYTDEFFSGLMKFIAPGKELVIMSIGHEKCRYVSAWKIVVTPHEVVHQSMDA